MVGGTTTTAGTGTTAATPTTTTTTMPNLVDDSSAAAAAAADDDHGKYHDDGMPVHLPRMPRLGEMLLLMMQMRPYNSSLLVVLALPSREHKLPPCLQVFVVACLLFLGSPQRWMKIDDE